MRADVGLGATLTAIRPSAHLPLYMRTFVTDQAESVHKVSINGAKNGAERSVNGVRKRPLWEQKSMIGGWESRFVGWTRAASRPPLILLSPCRRSGNGRLEAPSSSLLTILAGRALSQA